MVAQRREAELLLFPRQLRFVTSKARYPAYVGGIGSGKSFAGGAKVISRLGRKELGGIFAPTYQMLADSTLEGFFAMLDNLGIPYDYLKQEKTFTFANGHKILCRSLEDPNKARGPNLNYAWVDEAGYVTAEGWNIVKGRARIGDDYQAWVTGTPKGRNYLWAEWERDATGNEFDPTHPLFRVRTEENPELPDGFAQSLGYTDRFAAQELGGEFVAFEGLVYPRFQRSIHVKQVDCSGWPAVLGVDAGTRNPTAILTVRYSGDRRHIEREVYRRGMGSSDILSAIKSEMDRSGAEKAYIDPSALAIITDLVAEGYRAEAANNKVGDGIREMTELIGTNEDNASLTVDPDCVHTIAEYESYSYPQGGKAEVDNPVKANDHAMDGGRYAMMGLAAPRLTGALVV
jgi:PBSX family phage terminase large subunit